MSDIDNLLAPGLKALEKLQAGSSIADLRHTADLDVVHVEVIYKDCEPGTSLQIDIPLNLPRECFDYLPDMLLKPSGPGHAKAVVEPLLDDEWGWIPVLRFLF